MFGRRRVRRVTVNIPAWIEVGNSTLLERCTLVDLTVEGAKLVVGDISHLTDHFCLYLTRRAHLSQRCRIVWRRDHQVGVEFEGRDIPVHESTGAESARGAFGTKTMGVGITWVAAFLMHVWS